MNLSKPAMFLFLVFAGSCAFVLGISAGQGEPDLPEPDANLYSDMNVEKRNVETGTEEQVVKVAVDKRSPILCTYHGRHSFNPAVSCREILDCNPNADSGNYWIKIVHNNNVTAKRMYCDMKTEHCGVTGGWMRVANLDMTESLNQCPSGFKEVSSDRRMCVKSAQTGCSSVLFRTYGKAYGRVCGRARGYSYHSPDAFGEHTGPKNIDSNYVDGLSITYGSPRKHLWTYAAGLREIKAHDGDTCPCATNPGYSPPSFVGNDFYCESANQGQWERQWYFRDPLWDGHGCPAGNNCCANPGLPWFCKTLPIQSTEDIEARICMDEELSNENVGLEILEIYVQ